MTEPPPRDHRWTVRAFLLALVLACLLPGVLGTIALFAWEYRYSRDQQTQTTVLTARALMQAVDHHLLTVQAVAQALSTSKALEDGNLEQFHGEARQAIEHAGLATNVVLRDEAGRQLLNTRVPWGAALNAAPAPEQVRAVFATARPTISDLFVGPVLRRPILSVDVPVRYQGRVRYALGIGILPEQITAILQAQRLPSGWVVAVIDRQGVIAGRSRLADRFVGQPATPSVRAAMQHSAEGSAQAATADGIAAYVYFSRSPVTGWTAAIGIPREHVDAVMARASSLLALGVAVLFALGALLAWGIGGQIARSFRVLTDAATALGDGRWAQPPPLPVQEADDTLRSLGVAARLLRERSEHLQEADRRKDEFISILAHELRNPLAPVRTAVEILRRTSDTDARQQRAREIVERQVKHMARLIDDLLDVSRIARGRLALHRERCDLAQVTRQTAEDYRPSVEAAGHVLDIEIGDTSLWIEGDPVRVAQMVGNLLNNAVRFTERGGRITVRAGTEHQMAQVCVSDTGVGIAPELLARLFDPFSQADQDLARSKGGLGLGLALTRGLAQLHGGDLAAHSDGPGRGARFTLSLPLAPARAGSDGGGPVRTIEP